MRISDWSSDVCSSDLMQENWIGKAQGLEFSFKLAGGAPGFDVFTTRPDTLFGASFAAISPDHPLAERLAKDSPELAAFIELCRRQGTAAEQIDTRSEEHTSELQSLMRISYAVFCLKKKKNTLTTK